jgi:hypothetical protein
MYLSYSESGIRLRLTLGQIGMLRELFLYSRFLTPLRARGKRFITNAYNFDKLHNSSLGYWPFACSPFMHA